MNFLRGSKEEFEKYNPVLEDGQPCFVRDLKTDDNDKETVFYGIKIGDGKNNWIDLPYIGNANIDLEQVINHINNNDIHVTKEEKDKWNSFLQDISNKLDKDGDASKTYTNFETADERSNIESGDNLSLIFSKISKWFADMKTVSFTGDYNDLENKPEIPDKITYYVRSGITPAMHGVDLFGSDGSKTNAPLETYLRDMELKVVSTADNPDPHTDRGYLQLLTSFDTTLIFNRYDWSHPFTLHLSYVDKDDTSEINKTVMSVNISGNLHIGSLSEQFISDLYIKSSNDEYKFSVYAYCTFEPSNFADHDYVYYCVWLAVYCDKEVPYKAEGFGSKLVYTNTASNVFYSPADTDHWIDFDKMVQQNIVLTSENKTTYSLSKSGNQIILKGSDGSSSDVTDKDTKYELEQYENVYDSWSSGPIIILKDSDGNNSKFIVPNTYTIFQFNPIYTVNRGFSINNDEYKTILDLDYFVPSTYNPHYTWRSPIVLDIHVWFYLSKDGTRRDFRIRVYTSLPGGLRIPDMAFIQYLGNYNDVKNIKWTVGVGYSGIASGQITGSANVIRIGVDNETYSKITNANGNASMQYVTSANGVDLNIARTLTNVNNIPIEIIDTFINISRDELSSVATSGNYNDLSNKPTIPDISGKQDKSTAVTHTTNTAVGSATKPVYVAANGAATPISHSINADVPANAKFTDTTYKSATTSTAGLMSAADKKKLDDMDLSKYLPKSGGEMSGNINMAANQKDILVGTHRSTESFNPTAVAGGTVSKKLSLETGLTERRSLIGSWLDENSVWQNILSVRHRNGWNDGPNYGFYLRSLLTSNGSLFWNKQTGANTWQGERVLLDSTNYSTYAAKSGHTHAMIVNSEVVVNGANANPMWVRLGTLVSSGNFYSASIRVWTGSGANGNASQNSSFEIQIKDGWQSTESAVKACGVTIYRINCSTVKVKVIPTAHNTYVVWVYMPWGYWNGNFEVRGKYKSWTPQVLRQATEPEGTASDTAYYDQAFKGSTVAKANTLVDSGWKKMSLGSYASSGEVSYRTYGKQITITGKVVLKTAITSSPRAPQSIATTESLDFSNIKGCSGMGRSNSSTAVYFEAINFSGDNLVDAWSVGDSSISAGSTLYFTITGFID